MLELFPGDGIQQKVQPAKYFSCNPFQSSGSIQPISKQFALLISELKLSRDTYVIIIALVCIVLSRDTYYVPLILTMFKEQIVSWYL